MVNNLIRYIPPRKVINVPQENPPQQPTARICAHCKRPTGAHYKVTRFDTSGAEKGSVIVCCLLCLLNWTYQYSTAQGMQAAAGVVNAFNTVVEAFRGLRK